MSQLSPSQLPGPILNEQSQAQLEEMPITRHLMILRRHLFKIVAILIALFFVCCLLQTGLISYFQNH